MVDKICATISMLGLIVFMGIVTFKVMLPDLWIVTIVVLGIAIADFVRSFRESGNGSKNH